MTPASPFAWLTIRAAVFVTAALVGVLAGAGDLVPLAAFGFMYLALLLLTTDEGTTDD